MEDNDFLKNRISLAYKTINTLDIDLAVKFAKQIFNLKETGGKVLFMGNGASYTIANHAALDYMNQIGVPTICAADPAVLTAFSNDFGYDYTLERFCKIYYKDKDILVCISSSGNSTNVINAVKYVNSVGGNSVSFTGFKEDNPLSTMCGINFWVNSEIYNIVESVHNLWLATICDLLTNWMEDKVGLHGINI